MNTMADSASSFFQRLQDEITGALYLADGKPFHEDLWNYADGKGGGRTRVLDSGLLFEKAGVNFSDVSGEFPEDFARQLPGEGLAFRATGVSLVLHPHSPMVPTVHANFRYIERGSQGWFGGGADLTPYYPYREDCIHFHRIWRDVCDRHRPTADYAAFKKACDEYFYLKHRQEARGIGGIFFDYLSDWPDETFAFVQDAGKHFLPSYLPILESRKSESYGDREREFQLIRRGRYVEFNLIYDRGTLFGLRTGGRIESILMSLPRTVMWTYGYQPRRGSREAELLAFLKPRDWVNEVD